MRKKTNGAQTSMDQNKHIKLALTVTLTKKDVVPEWLRYGTNLTCESLLYENESESFYVCHSLSLAINITFSLRKNRSFMFIASSNVLNYRVRETESL